MASDSTFLASMAAVAVAGALAMALVFSGALDVPAPDPPAGTAPDPPAGTAPDPPAGTAPDPPAGQSPPSRPHTEGDAGSTGGPQPPPIELPARAGDKRAAPAPGATAPANAQAFYTRAELIEFLAEDGATSPTVAIAAKYPVGGRIIDIMIGRPTVPEPAAWVTGRQSIAEIEPDVILESPDSLTEDAGDFVTPDGAPSAMPPAAEGGIREGAGREGAPGHDLASPSPGHLEETLELAQRRIPGHDLASPSPGHSETNVQVEGVDEPDFVKNDARHIYILDGGELTIIDALPADLVEVITGDSAGEIRESYRPEDASITFRGKIGESDSYRYDNMFLDGDSLIIIYEARQWASVPIDDMDPTHAVAVPLSFTYVLWVDVTDRSAAVPSAEYVVDGEYGAARMIDGTVYLVTWTGLGELGAGLPGVRHSALDGRPPGMPCADPDASHTASGQAARAGRICSSDPIVPPAYYVGPVEGNPILTTVSALPRGGPDTAAAAQTYVLGSGDIEYVSRNAVYLAMPRMAPNADDILGGLRDTGLLMAMVEPVGAQWRQAALLAAADTGQPAGARLEATLSAVQSGYNNLAPKERGDALAVLDDTAWSWHHLAVQPDLKTEIFRIAIGSDGGGAPALSYGAAGRVRGEPLDQFSMDEYGGMLRVATNVLNDPELPHTAVHVLNARSMEAAASLEGIAPGETMRSARFAGDTLFLVTFRQIDPFFVIDMSGAVPVILGELKIPGFSSYLQPYGADTVVGVGTYLSEDGLDWERDGGVKVSLYDVSDYRRPVLADEHVIGGSGTWSPAQSNHRALLADEGRGIIALPVAFDFGRPLREGAAIPGAAASDDAGWTGFYAFRVAYTGASGDSSGYAAAGGARLGDAHIVSHGVAVDGAPQEGRSLYIADWLYTIYDGMLVVSDLHDPSRMVKSIDLG